MHNDIEDVAGGTPSLISGQICSKQHTSTEPSSLAPYYRLPTVMRTHVHVLPVQMEQLMYAGTDG